MLSSAENQKNVLPKSKVKQIDDSSSLIIPATAFTEAIESIVQHPLTEISDADPTVEDQLLDATPFDCIIINNVM